MVDKVKPLKIESVAGGGTEEDAHQTETNPAEDYLAAKGISFENLDNRLLDLDSSGDLRVTDATHAGLTLRQIVRGTILAGISFATNSSIDSSDTLLLALGKIQAQITANINRLTAMDVVVTPQPTGNANAAGTSTAKARADHTHNTIIQNYVAMTGVTSSTTSGTDSLLAGTQIANPIAGQYLLHASVIFDTGQQNASTTFSVYVDGVQVTETEEPITRGGSQTGGHNQTYDVNTKVTVNGSQNVEIRWRRSAGTSSAYTRSLTLLKVG